MAILPLRPSMAIDYDGDHGEGNDLLLCVHVCMCVLCISSDKTRGSNSHIWGGYCQPYPLLPTPPASADHDCPWAPTDLQLTRLQINVRCSPRSKLIEHLRFTVFATSLLCCVRGSTPLPLALLAAELNQLVPLLRIALLTAWWSIAKECIWRA